MYVHRYLRLTPPLAACILIGMSIARYLGSGPIWPYRLKFIEKCCGQYWWKPLLYVGNYLPSVSANNSSIHRINYQNLILLFMQCSVQCEMLFGPWIFMNICLQRGSQSYIYELCNNATVYFMYIFVRTSRYMLILFSLMRNIVTVSYVRWRVCTALTLMREKERSVSVQISKKNSIINIERIQ